jgi:hypothetical protein
VAAARENVWRAAPPGDITIDVDGTLLNVHSEKEEASATYKRGFGFHPLGAWCDTWPPASSPVPSSPGPR